MINRVVASLILVMFSIPGFSQISTPGVEVVANVERVSAGDWSSYYVIKVSVDVDPANCSGSGRYWFIEKDDPFAKDFISLAMTAFISEKPVAGWIDGQNCINNFPKLIRLTLGGAWQ